MFRGSLWFFLCFSLLGCEPLVLAASPVSKDDRNAAIFGYDPVAYFKDEKPMKGSGDYTFHWGGAQWYFTSQEHLDLFKEDPQAYLPQYGGFCAWALSQGRLSKANPEAWVIYQGKLYLNCSPAVHQLWLQDRDKMIEIADELWKKV
ncbi:MAG: YHS domain protein [Candidatus Omnitrophica bacterium]|nr:YHS domain protein [Candidatus Omnitrophota bacterium]